MHVRKHHWHILACVHRIYMFVSFLIRFQNFIKTNTRNVSRCVQHTSVPENVTGATSLGFA